MENSTTERSGSTSEELRRNPLHRSTENQNTNKNEGHEEVQSDQLNELPDWLQEFREILVELVLYSHGETLRLKIKILPDLLMNCQWSREQKWNRVRASIV